jgi:hypothetical protein
VPAVQETDTARDLDRRAAKDVLERRRQIEIERTTRTPEIVQQVVDALKGGDCVKLGRLALRTWSENPTVYYLASDTSEASRDDTVWKETVSVRQAVDVLADAPSGDVELDYRPLAVAFVNAWLADWGETPKATLEVE